MMSGNAALLPDLHGISSKSGTGRARQPGLNLPGLSTGKILSLLLCYDMLRTCYRLVIISAHSWQRIE